jgi:hypothetical protein
MMTARSNGRNVTGAIVTTGWPARSVPAQPQGGKTRLRKCLLSITLEQSRTWGNKLIYEVKAEKSGGGNLRSRTGVQRFNGARLLERYGFGILRFVHFVGCFVPGVLNRQSKRREAT